MTFWDKEFKHFILEPPYRVSMMMRWAGPSPTNASILYGCQVIFSDALLPIQLLIHGLEKQWKMPQSLGILHLHGRQERESRLLIPDQLSSGHHSHFRAK